MDEALAEVPGVYDIRLDEGIDALVLTWQDDVDGESYREGMERLLSAIRRRDASRLLADSRAQGRMERADRDWTVEDWEPRAIDAGLEHVAVVYPSDETAKQTVDMTARKRPFTELDRLFTADPDEARDWLRVV